MSGRECYRCKQWIEDGEEHGCSALWIMANPRDVKKAVTAIGETRVYTGVTRGKNLIVVVGQKKALGIAVRNDRPQKRYSGLLASLRGVGQRAVVS